MRDHTCLSRSGAGEDQKRTINMTDGIMLSRIQCSEKIQKLYSTVTLFARLRG